MTTAHAVYCVAVAAGCFTLSVLAGRYVWRAYCYLFESIHDARARQKARDDWRRERHHMATPGSAYVKGVRPTYRVTSNDK